MGKSIHFSGQPLYSQVIKLLNKSTILQTSSKYGGEHYIKRFDCWTHLVVMLYAVIMRFDLARDNGFPTGGSPQALSFGHNSYALTQYPFRCKQTASGGYI